MKERAEELIRKYGIRLADASHIAVPGGDKLPAQVKNEIISLKAVIIDILRRREEEEKRLREERERREEEEKEAILSGRQKIALVFQEGEYFSGYTPESLVASHLLEQVGAAHYLRGWGIVVNQEIIEKFGTSFYFRDVEKYIKEKKETEEEKRQARENEKREKLEQAKKTGQKVLIAEYLADCNDPNAECDVDIIRIWAMPDGTVKTERIHSY